MYPREQWPTSRAVTHGLAADRAIFVDESDSGRVMAEAASPRG